MISACEDGAEIRCAAEPSEAALDWAGECIHASDSPCPDGCEVPSNCWWEQPVAGQARARRFTDEEKEHNEDYLIGNSVDSYAFTVAKYLILGVALLIVNTVFWTFFFVARCICCCCHNFCCKPCAPKPREKGYSMTLQVRLPIFFYLIFIAGIVACAFLTFMGNEDITTAVDATFDHARDGVGEFSNFLNKAAVPMRNIGDLVEVAATDAGTILNNTEYIATDSTELKDSIASFGTIYETGLTEAGADITTLNADMEANVDPMVETMQDMLNTLQTSLVDGKEQLLTTIADAVSQIESLNGTVQGFNTDIDDYQGKSDDYTMLRKGGVLAIFAVALFCVFFGLIGVFAYVSPCQGNDFLIYLMNLTWIFGSFVVTLALLLGGITMVAAVASNDVCHFLDIAVEDFEPYVGVSTAGGMNACFQGDSLVDAYNLTQKVDFQASIDAKLAQIEEFDVDVAFETVETALTSIADQIDEIDLTPLAANLNKATDIVNNADADPAAQANCPFADAYTLNNIETPWDTHVAGTFTAWNTASGSSQSYDWDGIETNVVYMTRIYTVVGKCTGTGCTASDGTPRSAGQECTAGVDCNFLCSELTDAIPGAYSQITSMIKAKNDMQADLGQTCPAGATCPTAAFVAAGHEATILAQVASYKAKLTTTRDDLLGVTAAAIGSIMNEIETMLCSMDCSFVGEVYSNVDESLCTTLLGGVLQISVSLWLLSTCMFFTSVIGAILVVRMRGVSHDEADENANVDDENNKGVNLNLYG